VYTDGKQKETTMDPAREVADEQMALWNGRSGNAWVDLQAALDQLFLPFEHMMVEAVAAGSHRNVLDVGCGTGSTTLAIARRLGNQGRAVGIDISEPMLGLARARAAREQVPATFIRADAQTYAFEPATFDFIVSRFGVMFFEDFVRAFANLRHAVKNGGAIQVITWRSPAENPFMTTGERAAAPLLPSMPPRRPDAPGQFALADERRFRRILEESGWREIDIQPVDVACALPEPELRRYATRLGPVGAFLQDADESTRARVSEAVRAAFDPYVHGTEVRFTAACWRASARQVNSG
jgi:ubiquinone/menaquinone biosynthesis C-methylase UbiE